MVIVKIAAAGLFGMVGVAALAQAPSMEQAPGNSAGVRAGLDNGDRDSLPKSKNAGNIEPGDTKSNIASTLPAPSVGADATLHDYLVAARASVVAGRTGQAQQSLEMAETRALGGSVVPDRAGVPNDSRTVTEISHALHALGSGDKEETLHAIDAVLTN
jgi:hypothetical protein